MIEKIVTTLIAMLAPFTRAPGPDRRDLQPIPIRTDDQRSAPRER